ncbi:MAG: glycine--tRNA ligase subunit beta, partial [Brevinematia bacterium]
LPEKQEDKKIIKKGPSKHIAYTSDGQPTQALKGFLSSVSSLQGEIKILREGEKEFVFFEGKQEGRYAKDILKDEIPKIVKTLKFPKTMKWSDVGYSFVRPVRWLVCMLGKEVIDIEIGGVRASNISCGHRFIGENIRIEDPKHYEVLLETKGKVIPSPEKRKQVILSKVDEVEKKLGCKSLLSDRLLEEIVNLVEYPDCGVGTFDETFLTVPSEILVSEMVDHQKFIPLTQDGKLINKFIIITNTIPNEKIVKGNEKVISARLNDGKFLYEEDLKRSINFFVEKTKELVFFGELGTVYDKMQRMEKLSEIVCDILKVEGKEEIVRSASISKFDLTTGVVYEFPELQGIMGYYYSLAFKESKKVAEYIKEHYKPISADDELPSTVGGSILSIVDKLDSIFSLYSAGRKVSGSSDPYGLRRQLIGVSRICIHNSFDLDIIDVFERAVGLYESFLRRSKEEVKEDLEQFISVRLKGLFREMGFRTDEIESTVRKTTNPYDAYLRVKAVNSFRNRGEFVDVAILFKRVRNILLEAGFTSPKEVDLCLLTQEERELYSLILSKKESVEKKIADKNYEEVLNLLLEFQKPVHIFFERVFVMDQNQKIRENRLSILYRLYEMFEKLVDFNAMEFA